MNQPYKEENQAVLIQARMKTCTGNDHARVARTPMGWEGLERESRRWPLAFVSQEISGEEESWRKI